MTTKSPTSTCGAYWGLCLPRSRIAVWLASRPSTTSVASMTCQVRAISPGLGEYVRTALVSSVGRRDGWSFRLTENGRRCDTRAPAGLRAPADHDTSRRTPSLRRSGDLAEQPRPDVVDGAAYVVREQVRGLPDQPHRLADVVVHVGERPRRPRWPAARGLLDEVGEAHVVGRHQSALGVVHQHDLAGVEHVLGDRERADRVLGDDPAGVADD